ncbi:MAG: PLP-dependent aminotransferase family protein [Solobacterium sp.]|nr:PLP-dependent aminotransferase family protein [Solobacterium sp.]
MRYTFDDTRPVYMQIYEYMRGDIIRGTYRYDEKIPSKRTLAQELHVSLITVEHAYDFLAEEGYIISRQRKGYYVCYRSEDLFPVAEGDPDDEGTAFETDEDLFPASVFKKAVREVLHKYDEKLLSASEPCGCFELRQAVSLYLARSRGIYADPSQVFIGAGAEYLYSMIILLLGRHRIYGIEDPSYERIRQMYRENGVRIDRLKMTENGIRSDELARTPASVLHVTPYRSFPSLYSADIDKRNEYLEWAYSRNAYIIEDDYESEFATAEKPADTLFAMSHGNVIYMNTFTKTISPALRTGYMILPEKECERFRSILSERSCTVPVLVQLTLAYLINDGSFERHINRVRRKRREK